MPTPYFEMFEISKPVLFRDRLYPFVSPSISFKKVPLKRSINDSKTAPVCIFKIS